MRRILFLLFSLILIFSCRRDSIENILVASPNDFNKTNYLPIPPLLKPSRLSEKSVSYTLTVRSGVTEFFKGAPVITYGYNGNLLGPTIRVRNGQRTSITVSNKLREYTTVHWHGMLVPGEMDGGPHQVIGPDKKWTASFIVNQPAATAWYHPHGIGNTAIQVYRGLAGLLIVDDAVSEKLNLPDEYGVNDIPLIVQDKRFTEDGVPLYLTSMMDIMAGMLGNTIVVNGAVNPSLKVKGIKYRFRILNGSNARVYDFSLSNGDSFYQIATDAGLLEKPVALKDIMLSPGERAEIIIDFSKYRTGKDLLLVSGSFTIINFEIGEKTEDKTVIPDRLATINAPKITASKRKRIFSLEGMGHNVSINGKRMDMNRMDEFVKLGNTETWVITSSTRGMGMMGGMRGRGMMGMMGNVFHNFHAHGIHFLVLERNGRPPFDSERGWKDTVLLSDGEEVSVITKFLYKGIYMYHCHILEHEDNGMMGQFKVE